MKPYAFALLAVFGLAALPLCQADEAAAPAPAPAAALPTDHIGIAEAALDTLDDIIVLLESVTDKASADAAAGKMSALKEKMSAIMVAGQALGEPTEEVRASLQAMSDKAQAKLGAMLQALHTLVAQDCYGSDALEQVLKSAI